MIYSRNIRFSSSEERLSKLLSKRLEVGADKEKIDEKIWDLFGEQWAVMFTDLTGFSRKVEKFGIIHFLQTIYESERILVPIIEEFDGILIKMEGDSMLVIFRNVEKAVSCSLAMQEHLKEYNRAKTGEEKILLCVGISWGKILKIGDYDVYGSAVNKSSKLGEEVAFSGEVLVTEEVVELCREKFCFKEHSVKEISGLMSKIFILDMKWE
ncbi:adenylate/guanylate cyclase domain-containing protein [candidate division WOR-3 bacterium]|nr:adenylate/guanylate cyclase domain-containing protein [candidate division WOR-3 bacterium]